MFLVIFREVFTFSQKAKQKQRSILECSERGHLIDFWHLLSQVGVKGRLISLFCPSSPPLFSCLWPGNLSHCAILKQLIPNSFYLGRQEGYKETCNRWYTGVSFTNNLSQQHMTAAWRHGIHTVPGKGHKSMFLCIHLTNFKGGRAIYLFYFSTTPWISV